MCPKQTQQTDWSGHNVTSSVLQRRHGHQLAVRHCTVRQARGIDTSHAVTVLPPRQKGCTQLQHVAD